MKKILIILLVMCFCIRVNASGMSYDVDCPQGAAAGSIAQCSVYVKSDTATPLCALSAKLSVINATYDSFAASINLYSNTANGIVFDSNSSCISSKTKLGTLKIKMPNSGSATVKYADIQGSDVTGNIKSTAGDVTKTIKVQDSNNNLSSLTVNKGTLSPAFNPSTTSYKVNVDKNTTSIIISASAASSYAKVSGTGSKNLSYGDNKFTISVKSEDGKTKNYVILVNREDARNNDNSLKSLSIDNAVLNKAFNSNTLSYTSSVKSDIIKVKVNATVNNQLAKFVNGYGPREVALKYGVNKVEIKVRSEKEEVKTYIINITREDDRSSNNYLKSLSLSSGTIDFDKNIDTYNVSVKNDITSININASCEDTKASIKKDDTINLKEGDNISKVIVTAENGSTRTYTLNIKRLTLNESLSSNTNMKSLNIKGYNISFSKDNLDYIINLNDEDELDISYTLEDDSSKIDIIGNESLKDNSLVKLKVTSTDGSTKIYNLIIDKKEKNNNLVYLLIMIFEGVIILTLSVFTFISKKKNKLNNIEDSNNIANMDNPANEINQENQTSEVFK